MIIRNRKTLETGEREKKREREKERERLVLLNFLFEVGSLGSV